MVYVGSPTAAYPSWVISSRIESLDDKAYYEDPVTREAYNEVQKYTARDDAKWHQIVKDLTPFYLEQCVGEWLPVPHSYNMWWPWLKNYHGEGNLGYDNQMAISWYVWIDQDMKKSMGY